jgi:glycosyltransferase involved in cell wall biosynthesis
LPLAEGNQEPPAEPQRGQLARFWQRAWRAARRGRLLQSGMPWLRQRGVPLPMSPQAYAFDRYKRLRRLCLSVPDVSRISVPCQPGLVSVVLPAYNGEDFIEQAVASIIAQTYPHWELIAVDDGSTDSTGAILDRLSQADERIRSVHQENRKLPGALSAGFNLARGEFLTWTSCDNLLYPDFLERLVSCLHRHPDWDMIYANLDIIGEDGAPLRGTDWYRSYQIPLDSEHIHLPRDPAELNTRPDNYLGAAFLYRRRAALLLGDYSPARFTIEDYDYWMRVNALLTLRHADFSEPVYAYRFHSKSLTSHDKALAITARRDKLTVYDSFRRDFYLSPLLWQVSAGSASDVEMYAAQLNRLIERSGHRLLLPGQYDPDKLPRFWFPLLYVHITGEGHSPLPPRDLPASAQTVLVIPSKLPPELPEGWDLIACLGQSSGAEAGKPPTPACLFAPDLSALFTALDIWARSRHLAALERFAAHQPSPSVNISVVICTYQRPQRLANALASAATQTLPGDDFEVVIVNNDPDTAPIEALIPGWRDQLFKGDPSRLRLVHCPLLGLAYARNAGVSEARGEVICFLDDDAIADPDWLERLWAAYTAHPEAGVIGGKITLEKPDPPPKWLLPGWEVYWSSFDPGFPEFSPVEHWSQFPFGANWSARRQALLEAGGFPTRGFGRQGKRLQDGEEIAAAIMIQKTGCAIGVEPRAAVVHQVEPARFHPGFVWRKILMGRRRWYQSQVDLYLPFDLGLRPSLRRIGEAAWPPSLSALLKTPYLLVMETLVLLWYLRDLILRLRRPVTLG